MRKAHTIVTCWSHEPLVAQVGAGGLVPAGAGRGVALWGVREGGGGGGGGWWGGGRRGGGGAAVRRGCWQVGEQPGLDFAGLLRLWRERALLTQEGLAEAAGLSPRAVSDLERGIHRTARKDTAVLLAGALGL